MPLQPHYHQHVGYELCGDLPKHPYIKKHCRETIPHLFIEWAAKDLSAGPAAGKSAT